MTDQNFDAQDERSQAESIESLDMANLRKFAKILGLPAQRDWTKEDFVRAIKGKQEKTNSVALVLDGNKAPAPGYARIVIHRDMTPGHKNSPIHAGFNGLLFQIPRGVEVDVPHPLVESLSNARQIITVMGDDNVIREQEIQSYPFQILAVTPGEFKNPMDGRAAQHAPRRAFYDKFGRYPTDGELKEWLKRQIADVAF